MDREEIRQIVVETVKAVAADIGPEVSSLRGQIASIRSLVEEGFRDVRGDVKTVLDRIDAIEKEAQEMMSPDKMMDLATKFLG